MGFIVRPSEWEVEHHAAIFAGQAYEAEHGSLPDDGFWRMLEFRHSLNPARFDFYHPNIGVLIEHQGQPRRDHMTPHGWVGHMRGPTPPSLPPIHLGPCETPRVACHVEPPHTGHQAIPEPAASTMLAMAMMFVGGWWFLTKERAK